MNMNMNIGKGFKCLVLERVGLYLLKCVNFVFAELRETSEVI